MISTSLTLIREASFFSKKTAQIIKSAINPPKKVANAYSIFYMEKYPEYKGSNLKITEISKEVGSKWNSLSQEQKSIYEAKAAELKTKYEAEKKNFTSHLNDRQKLALELLNLNRRAIVGKAKRSDLNAEQKEFLKSMPEPSAFTPRGIFISQRLKGVSASQTKPIDGLADSMKAWSNLSAKEQEPFIQKAQQNFNSFVENITNFLKK